MSPEEAEPLLSLHREGRTAAGRVQKALRYAEGHDTLRGKLEEQGTFDDQVVRAIHSIKPPENLRRKLREVSAASAPKERKRSPYLCTATFAAVIGVLVIVGFVVWTVMEKMERFPGIESLERMLAVTDRMSGVELEPMATSSGTLGDWFYMRGFEGYALPAEIGTLPVVGSRVLRVDEHPVAQLAVDRQNSILYVFHASDFGVRIPDGGKWTVFDFDEWTAGVRREGGLCYMVAMRGSEDDMQALLQSLKK
jgi:hypothetical protein